MANKPFRVYLSSTFSDLQEHRQAAVEAIRRLGASAVAMEQFGASSEPPVSVCEREVRESDALVLLIAYRYGVVFPQQEESLTEIEFNTARSAGIPIFAFMVYDHYPWPTELIDGGADALRLQSFKQRVRSDLIVGYFTSPSDLALRVTQALAEFLFSRGIEPTEVLEPQESEAERSADISHDQLVIKIEEHLNSLRTSVAEIRDRVEQSRSESNTNSGSLSRSASFLGPAAALEEDLCFVAMPYSKDWSKALEDILLDICKSSGMKLLIAKNMDGRFVPHDIWQGITAAAVVVADITDGNPNVAYEVGLADVLGKEVVLLCQGDQVPFDFQGQRLICYADSMKGTIVLREELTARLKRLRQNLNEP